MHLLSVKRRTACTWVALGALAAAPVVVALAGLYVGATLAACAGLVLHANSH